MTIYAMFLYFYAASTGTVCNPTGTYNNLETWPTRAVDPRSADAEGAMADRVVSLSGTVGSDRSTPRWAGLAGGGIRGWVAEMTSLT